MRKKIVLSTTSFSLFFTIIVASLYRNVITLIHLRVKIDIGRLTSSYLQRNNSFETEIAFIYVYIPSALKIIVDASILSVSLKIDVFFSIVGGKKKMHTHADAFGAWPR